MSNWYTNNMNEPIKHFAGHKKSETEQYILCNTIYITFWTGIIHNTKNNFLKKKKRNSDKCLPQRVQDVGVWPKKDIRNLSGVTEILSILIQVEAVQVYALVKSIQII